MLMRVFNFSSGPAMLPLPVLEQVREELTDFRGSGMSLMEISHRSKVIAGVLQEAQALLRELLAIPARYKVLFLQGGAMGQFAAVPINLARPDSVVDYINTGAWSQRAISEAQRLIGRVNVIADEKASRYTTVPAAQSFAVTPGAAYVHHTLNETIGGVEFPYIPDSGAVPLVGDASSTILSRPLDVSRYGLLYAGAQKNMGTAGVAVVIVREDLIGKARPGTPSVWDYAAMAAEGSMVNTPPTFTIYVLGLVLNWVKALGGLTAMEARNRAKAQLLYSCIDQSGFYSCPVDPACRSWMNVPFLLANPELEKSFLAESAAAGLTHLEGHRSVGGLRASLYNAMPLEGVEALVAFMQDFQRRHA
jgi:phosphoserine aminotransferase